MELKLQNEREKFMNSIYAVLIKQEYQMNCFITQSFEKLFRKLTLHRISNELKKIFITPLQREKCFTRKHKRISFSEFAA